MRDRQLGTRGGDSSASPVATASTRYLSASMKGPPPARTIALCSLLSARLRLAPFCLHCHLCAYRCSSPVDLRTHCPVRVPSSRMRRSYLSTRRCLLACAVHTCPYADFSHVPLFSPKRPSRPAMKSSYTCPALRACVVLHLAKYLALPNRAACVPLRLCNVYAKVRGRLLRIFLPATPRISNCTLTVYYQHHSHESVISRFSLHAVPPPASPRYA